jgi:hypothetical protein
VRARTPRAPGEKRNACVHGVSAFISALFHLDRPEIEALLGAAAQCRGARCTYEDRFWRIEISYNQNKAQEVEFSLTGVGETLPMMTEKRGRGHDQCDFHRQ